MKRRTFVPQLIRNYAHYSYKPSFDKRYTHFRRRMLERYHSHINYDIVNQMKQFIIDNKAEYLGSGGFQTTSIYRIPMAGLLLQNNPDTKYKSVTVIVHRERLFMITALPPDMYANVIILPEPQKKRGLRK